MLSPAGDYVDRVVTLLADQHKSASLQAYSGLEAIVVKSARGWSSVRLLGSGDVVAWRSRHWRSSRAATAAEASPEASDDAALDIMTRFLCPITGEPMKDPVVGEDGHSYERGAIRRWFKQCDRERKARTSPMTGEVMGGDLVPNVTLRAMMEDAGIKTMPVHGLKRQTSVNDEGKNELDEHSAGRIDFPGDVTYYGQYRGDRVPHGKGIFLFGLEGDSVFAGTFDGGMSVGICMLDDTNHAYVGEFASGDPRDGAPLKSGLGTLIPFDRQGDPVLVDVKVGRWEADSLVEENRTVDENGTDVCYFCQHDCDEGNVCCNCCVCPQCNYTSESGFCPLHMCFFCEEAGFCPEIAFHRTWRRPQH